MGTDVAQRQVLGISSVFFVLVTASFLARIRRSFGRRGSREVILCLTYLLTCLLFGISFTFVFINLNKSQQFETGVWSSSAKKINYAYGIILTAQGLSAKLCIMLMIYDLAAFFQISTNQKVRRLFVVLQYVLFLLLIPMVFRCVPLSHAYKATPTRTDKCMNITAMMYAQSAIAIADEVLLLGLACHLARKLSTRVHRQVSGLFILLGLLVVAGHGCQIFYQSNGSSQAQNTPTTQIVTWSLLKNYVMVIIAFCPQAMLHDHSRRSSTYTFDSRTTRKSISPLEGHILGDCSEAALVTKNLALGILPTDVQVKVQKCRDSDDLDPRAPDSAANWLQLGETATAEGVFTKDKHTWLRNMPKINTDPRFTGIDNERISPFWTRPGEWEDIYPAEQVEIKSFDQQFQRAPSVFGTLPFSDSETGEVLRVDGSTLRRGSLQEMLGRSINQKDYFDMIKGLRDGSETFSAPGHSDRRRSSTRTYTSERRKSSLQSTLNPLREEHHANSQAAEDETSIQMFERFPFTEEGSLSHISDLKER